MGWFDDAVDWVGDNVGDLFDIGSGIADHYANEKAQENLKDIARKQQKEILRVADYNAMLQRQDAQTAFETSMDLKIATDHEYLNNARNAERIIATQTARYGKAGVAPSSGTPMNVALATASEAEREGRMILHNGRRAQHAAIDMANKLHLSADETLRAAAIQADVLEDAMKDELTALEYDQWRTGAQNLFNYGIKNDWWSE